MIEQLRTVSETAFVICFEVSVWNCIAELVAYTETPDGKRCYLDIVADEEVLDRLDELAEESVYRAGGAINISGLYPLSDELKCYLVECLARGTIRLVPRTPKPKE